MYVFKHYFVVFISMHCVTSGPRIFQNMESVRAKRTSDNGLHSNKVGGNYSINFRLKKAKLIRSRFIYALEYN